VNIAGFMDLGFIAYFIIGYVLATEKISKKWKWLIYGLGIAGLIMTIVFTVGRSRALGTDFALENDGLGDLGIFLFASAAFVWVREVIGNRKKVGRAVSFMAKHSLGIYVIHALPILLFSRFFEMPSYSMPSMFVIIPGSVLMIYGFSLLVSWLFSKIPLLNKVV
jgi:surface polysaccharide O-acyltransferase-like enzyme